MADRDGASRGAGVLDDRRPADLFEELLRCSPEVIVLCDPDGRIDYVNETITRVMGYAPSEVRGADLCCLADAADQPALIEALGEARSGRTTSEIPAEVRLRHADRSLHWYELTVRRHPAGSGPAALLCYLRNVTKQRAAYENALYHATHDGLTGLVNRVVFDRDLKRALAQSRRYGHGVAVLFCDLDGFKAVNDTHGHAQGDQLLAGIGAIISRNTRSCDTVARLGGDEFGVLLTPVDDAADAMAVANRIVAGIRSDPCVAGLIPEVGCSIGVAFASGAGHRPDTVLALADSAMYAAKGRGPNSVLLGHGAMAFAPATKAPPS
jgi:diguanylate cyclase (GGDEF)-like protein/PAS domain S-box-containing protein